MVRCLGYAVSDIEQKDAEGKKDHDTDLDLLSRSTEEYGKQQHRSHEAGKNDIHDVESVSPFHIEHELYIGKSLIRAALEGKFLPNDFRGVDFPFSVLLKRIHVDNGFHVCQVHLSRVVAPCSENQSTLLLIKWIVRDVDFTNSLEYATRLPVNFPFVADNGTKLAVVPVNAISPGSE